MRRRLLGIGAFLLVGLGTVLAFPPVAWPGRLTPGVSASLAAWRDLIAPPDTEWVSPGKEEGWPGTSPSTSDSDFTRLRPVALPLLIAEGLVILAAAAAVLIWTALGARYRQALIACQAPSALARVAPPACLAALSLLATVVAAVRVPISEVVRTDHFANPGLPPSLEESPFPEHNVPDDEHLTVTGYPRTSQWVWFVGRGPFYTLGRFGQLRIYESSTRLGLLLVEGLVIVLVSVFAAWLGILRPRRRLRALAAAPAELPAA